MAWGERVLSQPAKQPITLAALKKWLRMEGDDTRDDILQACIRAATDRCQTITRRKLITQSLQFTRHGWPAGGCFHLPYPPVQEVTAIRYYDAANVLQDLAATVYRVHLDAEPVIVELVAGQSWPTLGERLMAVQVEYVAGYGDPEDVPEGLKQAVALTAMHYFENPAEIVVGTSVAKMPEAAESILERYTIGDEFLRYDHA